MPPRLPRIVANPHTTTTRLIGAGHSTTALLSSTAYLLFTSTRPRKQWPKPSKVVPRLYEAHLIRIITSLQKAAASPPSNLDALTVFFNSFPGFEHDTPASLNIEFSRLEQHMAWPSFSEQKLHNARKAAYAAFSTALVCYFSHHFGVDPSDVEAWRRICDFVGAEVEGDDVGEMQKAVRAMHFSLLEMVQCHRLGNKDALQKFETEEELRSYMKERKLVFPRYKVFQNRLLEEILMGRATKPKSRRTVINEISAE